MIERPAAACSSVLVGFILVLSGCPFGVNQLNRLPDSKPLAEPVLFNRPGPLVHEASGFEFRESYDHFQRVTAYRYDTAALDVGLGYNDRWSACVIAATFYVYPTPRRSFLGAPPDVVSSLERGWLNDEFTRSKREIEHHHPAAHSAATGPVSTPVRGEILHGSSLTFRESGNFSELRLFVYERRWFLKYRFTYPESCQTEAAPRLEALIQQLPWAAAQQGSAS